MICQLCLKDFPNLCKAHIIPKSFIKFMYPNGKIEGESLIMILNELDYKKSRRVGMYDENILCQECDNWVGKEYDEYGKKYF